ncbi:MAG: 2-oxo acid dehydrogenase subunit E2 [Proteobacteria bacterium]|nr:2-oxo acid dehydrogenase subunit E2 [Pseudomonadota bacterium]
MKTFHLPDLGEGLPDGEITQWHVKEGDFIKMDDPLVSIETAKAIVEVPSPFTGRISKLYGQQGDIIPTGAPLVDIEGDEKKASSTVAGEIPSSNEVITQQATLISGRAGIKILPAVRALAKKLNVDLNTIIPSGQDGTITAEDVKKASQVLSSAGPLEPLKGVRRVMALAMSQSHREVVPVTILDDVDISTWVKEKDFTVRVMQAMVKACQQEPALNAWFDGQAMGRRLFSNVNIGLAMDSQDGLFVPVIKDVQEKPAKALREEIESLKKQVESRSVSPETFQGATIVLSNFGKFAGRYANPIIVVPTVAILGVGALREEIRQVDGQIKACAILPLSLSFDHRAVSGGEATRFLATIIQALKN